MSTKQVIKRFHALSGAGMLGAILIAGSAYAADQSEWLSQQLAITDGASPAFFCRIVLCTPPGFGSEVVDRSPAGAPSPAAKTDVQSEWLQRQLAISDGSTGAPPSYVQPTPIGAAGPRANDSDAESAKQFAFVQHELLRSDGSGE